MSTTNQPIDLLYPFVRARTSNIGRAVNTISAKLSQKYGLNSNTVSSSLSAMLEILYKDYEMEYATVCFPADDFSPYVMHAPGDMPGVHVKLVYDMDDDIYEFFITNVDECKNELMIEGYEVSSLADVHMLVTNMRRKYGLFGEYDANDLMWDKMDGGDTPAGKRSPVIILSEHSIQLKERDDDLWTASEICRKLLEPTPGVKLAVWKDETASHFGLYRLVMAHYPYEKARHGDPTTAAESKP